MIFILPLLAVLIGYLIAKFLKPSSSSTFKLLLSFSGAYLLSVTVFELLPEVYEHSGKEIGVFILLGLLFQIILEFISKGLEHGHMHHNPNTQQFPLMLLVSLGIHSLLEGFPLNESSHLLYGVAIHKIPVAAILSIFLFNSKIGNIKAFLFLLLFALMTPLGSWLKLQFEFIQTYAAYLNAIVIGVFLHISTTILFEASKNHKFNASKLGVIILGIILAYFM
ncbi:MAG: ZIP family metal transporter [Zunongwangia sp.]|uniref:ZIP family metal transporter n=2 Tax=Zunongwangia profunda TaxID=398743 RepID=D5B990_ZUNPS|nr:ZIP family metal transporter [Zunongwangia profunda]MAG87465.1 ZIP family metal transporter [Flavobacteriaceae bacterium]MAO35734.1 ZIP family metal transporter [Zunongwangia sp.]ADF52175.1 ZIP family metal transporter [Zunongwangia profunda SM-A87]MAS70942.1 ZIP family metal transporter [Zunongwangia sp.]HAJ81688.1 ZIP family metal transporter [Zunongwangia profunda]|tara:strand:+ start:1318 stop:1986 length:669 start_codon:yes stop_codon:yes gene_type:complete